MKNSVWDRIEQARERWNVLEHPFYQRWSAGELSREELADYSGQYRHAVVAIATASEYVASELPDEGLEAHAREEAEHVGLWDGFVDAVGGDARAAANPETSECVAAWTSRDGLVGSLARLYAVESGQPAISQTKLEGLAAHYDVPAGEGTRYFELHRGRDVEHAAEGRELLERHASPEDADAIVAAAESAFEANWKLLDGVS